MYCGGMRYVCHRDFGREATGGASDENSDRSRPTGGRRRLAAKGMGIETVSPAFFDLLAYFGGDNAERRERIERARFNES